MRMLLILLLAIALCVLISQAFTTNAQCYDLPAPEGSKAKFCDVIDPASGSHYVIWMVSPGGIWGAKN